jgi:hypothetical protein
MQSSRYLEKHSYTRAETNPKSGISLDPDTIATRTRSKNDVNYVHPNIPSHWNVHKSGASQDICQLLTTEELNARDHQIIFRRMGDYATDVTFHHVHIPVPLDMINNVANTAMAKIRSYAKFLYHESMMHYHEDNQYAGTRKAEGCAKLITDQNLFVIQESEKSIKYFQEDLKSLTRALPISASKISKQQIDLLFGFIGTAFGTINAIQINSHQKQTLSDKGDILLLTHIIEIQENHLQHLEIQNEEQSKIILNALRYNPAMPATAAHKLVIKTSDTIHKVKATTQQAQNKGCQQNSKREIL